MLGLLLWVACQEYGIKDLEPRVPEPVDTDPPAVDTSPPESPPEEPPPDPPSCEGVSLTVEEVVASAPFAEQADPVDTVGVPFHQPGFNTSSWAAVALPDVGTIPRGSDRVYRGVLRVVGSPPGTKLELQSDDGISVWINGARVGTWGGAWQQEGCVNDDASCIVFEYVDPVDISTRVQEGDNLIAFRVSNPIANSYADLRVHCVVP